MKVSKKHFAVIISEVIMMVIAIAALVFYVLTYVSNGKPCYALFAIFFDIPGSVGVFSGILGYYLLVSVVILFTSIITGTWLGLFYTLEYALLGFLLGMSYTSWALIPYCSGNSLTLAVVTVVFATIAMIAAFTFLILFFSYATFVFKRRVAKAKAKKEAKAIKIEAERKKLEEEEKAKLALKEEKAKQKAEKKVSPKKASKVETKKESKKEAEVEESKDDEKGERVMTNKVYHISQHPTTNKWQVKLAKGEKALKLFDTQAEALAYAKEVAKNQGGSIRLHSRKGKIRSA